MLEVRQIKLDELGAERDIFDAEDLPYVTVSEVGCVSSETHDGVLYISAHAESKTFDSGGIIGDWVKLHLNGTSPEKTVVTIITAAVVPVGISELRNTPADADGVVIGER